MVNNLPFQILTDDPGLNPSSQVILIDPKDLILKHKDIEISKTARQTINSLFITSQHNQVPLELYLATRSSAALPEDT